MSEWVSVKDRLPENGTYLVRVYRDATVTSPSANFICTASLSMISVHCFDGSPIRSAWYVYPSSGHEVTNDVTHWMPLPKPPKGLK